MDDVLSGDCSQPLEWEGFISRYLLSPCHEILSQPLITGFCFLSPPWPFVHWQWRPRTWMTHGDQLPCVSPPIYPGHIQDSHSRHDLFWSTRFCISWTHWIHAVHCGLRLNVSWAFYGHRAKVSRLHIVNDNLKGIRNRAKKIFSPWQNTSRQGERFLLLSHSQRLHVRIICNTAHIWVVLGSRLENWVERENHINLSSYQNLLLPRLSSDPSSSGCSLTTGALNLSS